MSCTGSTTRATSSPPTSKVSARYFGLHLADGGGVEARQGDDIGDSGDVVALDENLAQSDRYIDMETRARS